MKNREFMTNKLVIAVAMLCTLMLSACGGGGSDAPPSYGDDTTTNNLPVASAGFDQATYTGDTVWASSRGSSDPEGGPLTYSWGITGKPASSVATLSDSTVASPNFTADKDGSYVLSLVVNDGTQNSVADSVTITSTVTNNPLPDTGQGSWNADPIIGQDADYTINPPSYINNGDGTITDKVTGLMWQQQDDDIFYNWYGASGTLDPGNPSSPDVCGDLILSVHSDWRLPTDLELQGIVDYGSYSPAIDSFIFPGTDAAKYWTLTASGSSATSAWHVNFTTGDLSITQKNDKTLFVRCVRGGPLSFGNFTDNGNGTVTDTGTSLIWQKQGTNNLTAGGINYCEALDLAGSQDWRLPNIKELRSIVDGTTFDPAIDATIFPGGTSGDVYSSSTYLASPVSVPPWWGISLAGGHTYTNGTYARCVRGGN